MVADYFGLKNRYKLNIMLKILYTACKYDYMDARGGYGFEHYNFYETLSKLPQFEVIYFPYERIHEVGIEKMNAELKELVNKEKPDILFAVMFTNELDKKIIGGISKNTNTQTVAWFCDDTWRFDNYSKYWAPYFNWVVTTDYQAPAKYNKIGYKNIIKSQWACNNLLYKPFDLPKIYDITFIGQPYGERRKIIEKIRKAGIKIECWGKGWPNGRVSQEEMIKIFSQSKININLTKSSGSISLKELARIFMKKVNGMVRIDSPRYWIDNFKSFLNKRRVQIKGRNFEIPGCGGFLMTEDADNLRDYYQDGKEIVIYKNTEDLIEKIKYYLKHDEEREAIAKAGYERTLEDNTYEKRFNEIFKTIGLIK